MSLGTSSRISVASITQQKIQNLQTEYSHLYSQKNIMDTSTHKQTSLFCRTKSDEEEIKLVTMTSKLRRMSFDGNMNSKSQLNDKKVSHLKKCVTNIYIYIFFLQNDKISCFFEISTSK